MFLIILFDFAQVLLFEKLSIIQFIYHEAKYHGPWFYFCSVVSLSTSYSYFLHLINTKVRAYSSTVRAEAGVVTQVIGAVVDVQVRLHLWFFMVYS